MIDALENLSLVPPEIGQCFNERGRYWLPKPWRNSVSDIATKPDVTGNDYDSRKAIQLGSVPLETGLGSYWQSKTFQELMKHSESLYPWPWSKTTMFITGSIGSRMVSSLIHDPNMDTLYPWQLELTGAGQDNYDIDIYLSTEMMQFAKKNFPYRETNSRTVRGLKLLEVTEKLGEQTLHFQFHFIDGVDLGPIAQAVLLAPSHLYSIGIAINGPIFAAIDPFGVFKRTKNGEFVYHIKNQPPPMHLIDLDNPLKQNLVRVLDGFMIYALMTPYINHQYFQEFTIIKNWIEATLLKLTWKDENVLLEKYCKHANRMPYMDILDTIDETPRRLALFGLMPKLLEIADRHNHQEALGHIVFETAWFTRSLGHPNAINMDIDENEIFDPIKQKPKILKIASEIEWNKII